MHFCIHGITLSFILSLTACHSTKDHGWTPLTDNGAWTPTGESVDPRLSHRPAQVECAPPAWRDEFGALEVDTGACNYLSLSQPARVDFKEGDEIRLSAWWQTLIHVEPAIGHLAVYAEEELLWDEEIPIPGPGDTRELIVFAPTDYPAGTPITLHLHNHGHNTWSFETISVRR
jgi:hypothetical protein